jgi:hypothetical protein
LNRNEESFWELPSSLLFELSFHGWIANRKLSGPSIRMPNVHRKYCMFWRRKVRLCESMAIPYSLKVSSEVGAMFESDSLIE